MHATSTQAMTSHRTAAKAALAALIFAAGVALGAVAGTVVAPPATLLAAPVPVTIQALDPDAAGVRQHRDGEIGLGGATVDALRDQRVGEINAGSVPGESAMAAQRRGEINAGQQ
jgi:hypothetical protein